MLVNWDDKFSLNLQVIDSQHRHFMDLLNQFYIDIEQGVTREKLTHFLNDLKEHAQEHFAIEEEYFHKFNYLKKGHHIDAHSSFERKIDSYTSALKKENIDLNQIAQKIADYIFDWFAQHILKEDKDYVDLFVSEGVK